MVKGAVHAAMGGQTHKVKLLAGSPDILKYSCYLLVFQKLMFTAGDVYLYKVLVNYAAGAKVHVPDLAVAHLPVRQADIFPAGLKMAEGILGAERINIGGSLCPNCIGIVVTAFAPAIQNH